MDEGARVGCREEGGGGFTKSVFKCPGLLWKHTVWQEWGASGGCTWVETPGRSNAAFMQNVRPVPLSLSFSFSLFLSLALSSVATRALYLFLSRALSRSHSLSLSLSRTLPPGLSLSLFLSLLKGRGLNPG